MIVRINSGSAKKYCSMDLSMPLKLRTWISASLDLSIDGINTKHCLIKARSDECQPNNSQITFTTWTIAVLPASGRRELVSKLDQRCRLQISSVLMRGCHGWIAAWLSKLWSPGASGIESACSTHKFGDNSCIFDQQIVTSRQLQNIVKYDIYEVPLETML